MIEDLSNQELLSFIDPGSSETIFDAGCGTGANILLLHSKACRVIAMDYNPGAVERCKKRMLENKVQNVQVMQGSIAEVPLPADSVERIICMSVLQYLDDGEVQGAFREFARILRPAGTVILHVKNLSSLYLSTLLLLKMLKALFRRGTKLEFFRPFHWYLNQLTAAGFEVVDYNSFNWLMLEGMPKSLLSAIQKFEFEHFKQPYFRSRFIRRHGSDLKIKARLLKKA